jgi:hypothetical protein
MGLHPDALGDAMRPIGVDDEVDSPPAHDAFASFVSIDPR